MAWLESHQSLGRHIKTKRLSRKLGITVPATIGHLHLLWWWAMDNLPDGCISLLEPEDIADEMMWTGDAEELLTALIEVGFIDDIDGKLFIHDWHDYIGKLVDKRRTDAERKRMSRRVSKNNPSDVLRTSSGQSEDDPRDGAGNSTAQYSTVQNSTKEDIAGWIQLYKIKCRGIYEHEQIESYAGVLESDLIHLFLKKSEGKPTAYFKRIADDSIKDGITTLSGWKAKNERDAGQEGRLDFLDEL